MTMCQLRSPASPSGRGPEAFFVGSAIFHYLGPAFAVLLFARVDPLGVAWLRIVSAAALFALWRRPWRRLAGLDREGRRVVLALGAVFAVMNVCFYVRSTGCRPETKGSKLAADFAQPCESSLP